MKGHPPLIAMRLNGSVPTGNVHLHVGWPSHFTHSWPKYLPSIPQIEIEPSDDVRLLDFRVLTGLQVMVFAGEWSERVGELMDRLKSVNPKSVYLLCVREEEMTTWQR